jgi:hypothetical protein
MVRTSLLRGLAIGIGLAPVAAAQTVVTINSNITTSTTWTSNNVYSLSGDIYVEPGATLTIQAGTVIASLNNSTLAVCRGAQVIANGTRTAPIIFTSDNDRATWTNGDPTTGTFRQLANNEWGNLSIMGAGYISENQVGSNSAAPSASNYADMEGLSPGNTALNDYGGGNDNDDSGSLSYCSFRYGGRTSAPGVELNGLSLGGIGRNTEISYIEILNNLDDGIEVWGGTVNIKNFSIWNIGDDSLDMDQGWRGKAQFGLIVQGYSGVGSQGSGFGDNALELDGAELCSYQPVTTGTLYNLTVIGSPPSTAASSTAGDQLVEFRDNCNMQIRNSIFMDGGDNTIVNGVTDGENGNTGYGCNGTTTFAARWTTPYTTTSTVNPFANPAAAYTAQTSGNLIDFRDNVFFNNIRANAYNTANANFVFAGGNGTANANNSIVTSSPITSITRGSFTLVNGTNTTAPVTFLDPTPANDALTAVEFAPNDGFYTSAKFRGAFARGNNWLSGWSAAARFGLTSNSQANVDLGSSRPGLNGVPVHYTNGTWASGTQVTLAVDNIDPNLNIGVNVFGALPFGLPIFGGTLVPSPDVVTIAVGSAGSAQVGPFSIPAGLSGQAFYTQWAAFDLGVPSGEFAFSNAQLHILP